MLTKLRILMLTKLMGGRLRLLEVMFRFLTETDSTILFFNKFLTDFLDVSKNIFFKCVNHFLELRFFACILFPISLHGIFGYFFELLSEGFRLVLLLWDAMLENVCKYTEFAI